MKWLTVLFQVVDFFFKAAEFYIATPDGAKEFSDITKAVSEAEAAEAQTASSSPATTNARRS